MTWNSFKAHYISPRTVEATFGLLLVVMGLWGLVFDWFNTYLVALKGMAPYGWVVFGGIAVYGAVQYMAALFEAPTIRVLCCIVSIFVFGFLMSAMITERGPLGAHTPGFGFAALAHFWCYLRHSEVLGGGSE